MMELTEFHPAMLADVRQLVMDGKRVTGIKCYHGNVDDVRVTYVQVRVSDVRRSLRYMVIERPDDGTDLYRIRAHAYECLKAVGQHPNRPRDHRGDR